MLVQDEERRFRQKEHQKLLKQELLESINSQKQQMLQSRNSALREDIRDIDSKIHDYQSYQREQKLAKKNTQQNYS